MGVSKVTGVRGLRTLILRLVELRTDGIAPHLTCMVNIFNLTGDEQAGTNPKVRIADHPEANDQYASLWPQSSSAFPTAIRRSPSQVPLESSTIVEPVAIGTRLIFRSALPAHIARPIPHRPSQFRRPAFFYLCRAKIKSALK
jgi:hypothetical protein